MQYKDRHYTLVDFRKIETRMKLASKSYEVIQEGMWCHFKETVEGSTIFKDFDLPFDENVFNAISKTLEMAYGRLDFYKHQGLVSPERDTTVAELFDILNDFSRYHIPVKRRVIDFNDIEQVFANIVPLAYEGETIDRLKRYVEWTMLFVDSDLRLLNGVTPKFSIREVQRSENAYTLIKAYNDISTNPVNQKVVAIFEINQVEKRSEAISDYSGMEA